MAHYTLEGASYLGDNGLSSEPELSVSQPGAYLVEISCKGCVDLDILFSMLYLTSLWLLKLLFAREFLILLNFH